jgi:IS5 family transposase
MVVGFALKDFAEDAERGEVTCPGGQTSKSHFLDDRKETTTPQYASIRREHLSVERKLGEVVNRHGGRRARCRGHGRVLIQQLTACMATNVKRLVRLLCAPIEAAYSPT